MDSLSGAMQQSSAEWASARCSLHSRNRERIEGFSRIRSARSSGCKREEPKLAGNALCGSNRADAARLPYCGAGTARRRGGVAPSTATQPQYPLPHGNTRGIDRDSHARTRPIDDGQWECPLRSLPKVARSHAVRQGGPEDHHLQGHQRAACLSATISMPALRESGLFATRGLLYELDRPGPGGGKVTRAYRQNGSQSMSNRSHLRRFFQPTRKFRFPSNTSFAIEPNLQKLWTEASRSQRIRTGLSLGILVARERERTAGLDSIPKAMSRWLEALSRLPRTGQIRKPNYTIAVYTDAKLQLYAVFGSVHLNDDDPSNSGIFRTG